MTSRIERIEKALESMPVGTCGVKWDMVVWRVGGGWIVGEMGVRKDGFVHNIDSAVEWFAWKLGIEVPVAD